MIPLYLPLTLLFLAAPAVCPAQDLFAPGEKPVLVSRQFAFTEGPAADRKGNVFFTDQPNNRIWKYDTKGKLSVFMENAGRANGLYFDRQGNLIACADEQNQLWAIDPKGKVTVLVSNLQGKLLNGPNDVWVAPGGGLYFSDPYYQRNYWPRKRTELDGEKVYYLKDYTSVPQVAAADFRQPNGIIGTRDRKMLYIADLRANKTYRFVINADGTLSERTLFAEQGSDGMAIDALGNIYMTGRGVMVYNPAGQKIAQIDIPEKWTANVCFGGKETDILFITASEAVYTLKMKVKGGE